jgi:hypothetical protein
MIYQRNSHGRFSTWRSVAAGRLSFVRRKEGAQSARDGEGQYLPADGVRWGASALRDSWPGEFLAKAAAGPRGRTDRLLLNGTRAIKCHLRASARRKMGS